jgi:predicted ATPase
MNMITQFKITNFRQFAEPVTVSMQPITVLIGANNSGKSTILQALNIFQYCFENCLQRKGGNGDSSLELKNRNLGPDELSTLPMATPLDLWPQGKATGNHKSIRISAEFADGTELTFELSLSYNLFRIQPSLKNCPDQDAFLRSVRIQLVPIFSGLLPKEEFLTLPSRNERTRAQRHGEIVRNLIYNLKKEHPEQWALLVKLLQRLYPNVQLDVEYDEELAISARIDTRYQDAILHQPRDLIVSGSGFHQALQIFAGMLQHGVSTVLLDEPDSHLHARLQSSLMTIFSELSSNHGIQVVIATHSPHLVRSAPPGSVFVCRDGAVFPLARTGGDLELLDRLGAFDQMELVPLLQSKKICFVEEHADRELIKAFLRKQYPHEAEEILRRFSFLYTYQEPVSAGVLRMARQVRDIVGVDSDDPVGTNRPLRVLAVADRDYRTDEEVKSAEADLAKKAKEPKFGFEIELLVWNRNEIENYLLDLSAMDRAITAWAEANEVTPVWKLVRPGFKKFVKEAIAEGRESAVVAYASALQKKNRGWDLAKAMFEAKTAVESEWGDGIKWVDAKVVLGAARQWLQKQKIRCHLDSREIVEAMDALPEDVAKMVTKLRLLAIGNVRRRRIVKKLPAKKRPTRKKA